MFIFQASWRVIYVYSMFLTTFFSLLQLLLIFQINTKYLHISNYFFALGDDVIQAYISGIQFLPVSDAFVCIFDDLAVRYVYATMS